MYVVLASLRAELIRPQLVILSVPEGERSQIILVLAHHLLVEQGGPPVQLALLFLEHLLIYLYIGVDFLPGQDPYRCTGGLHDLDCGYLLLLKKCLLTCFDFLERYLKLVDKVLRFSSIHFQLVNPVLMQVADNLDGKKLPTLLRLPV
jgi:hypothetical protein